MIDVNSVIERFLELAGLQEADSRSQSMCACASLKLTSMLKDESFASDERVVFAAACEAYCQYVLAASCSQDSTLESLKAGDITISSDVSHLITSAEKLRNSALDTAAPLIERGSFYFGEVEVDDFKPCV